MATFIENDSLYPASIYELATNDPVIGGTMSGPLNAPTGGYSNAQAQGIVHRTAYLKKRMNPIGEIVMWGGSNAVLPYGYRECNGDSLNRTTFAELFAVVGTAFGTASGSTFNLPDLRGLFVRGVDGSANEDPDKATRTAMNTGGNTGNNIGSVQGDELKSHTHQVKFTPQGANPAEYDEAIIGTNNGVPNSIYTTSAGYNETRPKNAYLYYIIKCNN